MAVERPVDPSAERPSAAPLEYAMTPGQRAFLQNPSQRRGVLIVGSPSTTALARLMAADHRYRPQTQPMPMVAIDELGPGPTPEQLAATFTPPRLPVLSTKRGTSTYVSAADLREVGLTRQQVRARQRMLDKLERRRQRLRSRRR